MDSKGRPVEAVAELMRERGYSVTSPRAARELSGIGQGSMCHYFPTERGLGLAALSRNYQIQLDSWKTAFKDLEDPLEVLATYLTFPRDSPKGCRIGRMAQGRAVVADDGLRQPVAETFARLREMLAAVIGMARSQGHLPVDLEPGHLARTMVTVVQGGYVLAMAEQDRAPYDVACQDILELLRVVARTTGAIPGDDESVSS